MRRVVLAILTTFAFLGCEDSTDTKMIINADGCYVAEGAQTFLLPPKYQGCEYNVYVLHGANLIPIKGMRWIDKRYEPGSVEQYSTKN